MTVTYQGSQYWRHDWDPFVIQFSENWGIRWYGLAYVLGFLTAAWLLGLYFKHGRSPMNPERRFNALVVLILATLVGGRLGYMLLYDFNALLQAPWKIFKVWEGGMASHGGIAGLALAVLYLARKNVYSKRKLADIVVTLGPPGIFLGRLANFINGELWGNRPLGRCIPRRVSTRSSTPPQSALRSCVGRPVSHHLPAVAVLEEFRHPPLSGAIMWRILPALRPVPHCRGTIP